MKNHNSSIFWTTRIFSFCFHFSSHHSTLNSIFIFFTRNLLQKEKQLMCCFFSLSKKHCERSWAVTHQWQQKTSWRFYCAVALNWTRSPCCEKHVQYCKHNDGQCFEKHVCLFCFRVFFNLKIHSINFSKKKTLTITNTRLLCITR